MSWNHLKAAFGRLKSSYYNLLSIKCTYFYGCKKPKTKQNCGFKQKQLKDCTQKTLTKKNRDCFWQIICLSLKAQHSQLKSQQLVAVSKQEHPLLHFATCISKQQNTALKLACYKARNGSTSSFVVLSSPKHDFEFLQIFKSIILYKARLSVFMHWFHRPQYTSHSAFTLLLIRRLSLEAHFDL